MSIPNQSFLSAITTFVERLPEGAIDALTQAMATGQPKNWRSLQASLQRVLAAPHYREQIGHFLVAWQTEAPDAAPQTVAWAVQAAAHTLHQQRRAQTLEFVWTGPSSEQPLQRTAQVLQQVIELAHTELLIVSFAVYDIPEIREALLQAANRGVRIQLIIESAQESDGKLAYNSLAAFGTQIASRADVYYWPRNKRPTDQHGRHGSLHAKCAVADEQALLISSANLTHYALNLNMELGMLIRGGTGPQRVAQHFRQLIQRNVLVLAR